MIVNIFFLISYGKTVVSNFVTLVDHNNIIDQLYFSTVISKKTTETL